VKKVEEQIPRETLEGIRQERRPLGLRARIKVATTGEVGGYQALPPALAMFTTEGRETVDMTVTSL
jgi:hypothetical protein